MKPPNHRTATQRKPTSQNRKSGQEVAKQTPLGHFSNSTAAPASTNTKALRTLPRTHVDYWKPRLFRPAYYRDGRRLEVNNLCARIQHGGRREIFPLHSTNQD